MEKPPISVVEQNIRYLKFLMILFLSGIHITTKINFGSNLDLISSRPFTPSIPTVLPILSLDGHFSYHDIRHAAKDFGNQYKYFPSAILHPKSVSDISTTIKCIFQMGPTTKLTVAARGHGHSLLGQAQAPDGIVINMESLQVEMQIHQGELPYVDASGGELWINVLHETLKYGLAPKSWTDYLHLTVGGTLSNAGISGQAFHHGPQISNVHQLEIVTGKGEVMNCSADYNADLFYGVLGGLGQFGIITRARIALEPVPKMVKWIRVLYTDFSTFSKDQEMLISAKKSFDYIEGFVIINRTGLLNTWRSSFNQELPGNQFSSDGRILFCLELTKHFSPEEKNTMIQEVNSLLSKLSYISSTLFVAEVPYLDFLDRVHISEMKLRSKGMWDVQHPWLNLLIPSSKIQDFATEVFGNILTDNNNGPILIYPLHKSKWNNKTSAITPSEDIFYLVAFLSSALPSSSSGPGSLGHILAQNQRILDFCKKTHVGMKQYLPHHTTHQEWQEHFGTHWREFFQKKFAYDPLAILAPGQRIFQRR